MEFSTLVRFSKLVADSPSSESVSALLGEAVVDKCGALHALVVGTDDAGEFKVLSSHGSCKLDLEVLDLNGVASVAELRDAVLKICRDTGYHFRALPLISDAGLFGALGVLYLESHPPTDKGWTLIEGLTELTAISLNKAYQHQKLQQAFDDLRASQDALVRSERLRALGEMSAGIAHDLKNLLNPLQLYTDYLKDVADKPEEVLETAKRLDRVVNRGLETVERLRSFSRSSDETEADSTDLNAMAREAVEMSKAKLASVDLVLELGTAPRVLARSADCVTAIMNLIFNAVDAMKGIGKIKVRTGASDGGS